MTTKTLDYRKEFTVKVYGKEAYAILNTWEDENEKDYDRFCDHIQSEYDLPPGLVLRET